MNKVMLIGRLTKDAELVQLENSNRGAIKFIAAVNKVFSNKNGERDADFIPVIYWSNYVEKIHPYLTKGKLIGISGMISTRSYTTNEGVKRYTIEVEADNLQFLDSKKESAV